MMRTLLVVVVMLFAGASAMALTQHLTPDEVAMVLSTMIVGNQRCAFHPKDIPLKVPVAKLGQDLVDFLPGGRYSPLVEVKMQKAHEWIDAQDKATACKGMRETLVRFLPDIYK
jgi:hypothetical protein